MRRETKVVVSTEREETFEEMRASEIVNPNDEIAITYIYQILQKQHEVHTYLAEVASVVFVAEPVPRRDEINTTWVRRYDWIISKVLLDESFREVLNFISANEDIASGDIPDSPDDVEKLKSLIDNVSTSLGEIKGLTGQITNIFDSAVSSYRNAFNENRERIRQLKATQKRIERFLEHIHHNILHYCRAIWSQEDPQSRLMRYMQIYVPTQIDGYEANNEPLGDGSYRVGISWEVNQEAPFVPLADIINPAGPIGYAGNYAVFHLKDSPSINFSEPLGYYKMQYAELPELLIRPNENNAQEANGNGSTVFSGGVSGIITQPWKLTYHPYVLSFYEEGGNLKYKVMIRPLDGPSPDDPIATGAYVEGLEISLDSEGFKLKVSGSPQKGDEFDIIATLPQLRDPELLMIRRNYPLPPPGNEAEDRLFDNKLIEEMYRLMPRLAEELGQIAEDSGGNEEPKTVWQRLNQRQKELLRSFYHEFLLRREHTRQFLVDTNNLVLNLHVGSGSTLEPFKRAHRYIDVKRAAHDDESTALEIERRKARLESQDYGDPDTEKVIVVTNGENSTGVVAGALEATRTRKSNKSNE